MRNVKLIAADLRIVQRIIDTHRLNSMDQNPMGFRDLLCCAISDVERLSRNASSSASLFPELLDRYDEAVNAVEACLTRYAVTRHKGRRHEADRALAPLQERANRLRREILSAYAVAIGLPSSSVAERGEG